MPLCLSGPRSLSRLVVLALVCATVGLALSAGSASSHILSTGKAVASANAHGQRLINEGTYVAKVVTCTRLYPHVINCLLRFDTAATQSETRYACVERVHFLYTGHDDYVLKMRHIGRLCD